MFLKPRSYGSRLEARSAEAGEKKFCADEHYTQTGGLNIKNGKRKRKLLHPARKETRFALFTHALSRKVRSVDR